MTKEWINVLDITKNFQIEDIGDIEVRTHPDRWVFDGSEKARPIRWHVARILSSLVRSGVRHLAGLRVGSYFRIELSAIVSIQIAGGVRVIADLSWWILGLHLRLRSNYEQDIRIFIPSTIAQTVIVAHWP